MGVIKSWRNVLARETNSLKEIIQILHSGGLRIVLIVDKNNKLLGTITDGDIRRALINQYNMKDSVGLIMNKNPITVDAKAGIKGILSLMSSKELLHIPIVDKHNVLCGMETMQHLIDKPRFDNPVFIMAGGFGTRLHPLTKNIPKPLLKVGSKPILEMIIDQFINHGFHNFYISTHFQSEKIKEYFQSGERYNVSIKYIHEESPLGTAGSLGLLPNDLPDLPIIVMNGDLLTKVDFNNLLDFHSKSNSEATMCVREYDFQVPYGVIKIDKQKIIEIQEKPVHKFFVNAGIYVLNRSMVNKVDGKSYLDMTDLLSNEINVDSVGAFPIHEYWIDIGHIDEFERPNREVSNIFNE